MADIIISKMTAADISALAELEKLCFSVPWSEQAFRDELTNDVALFLVAKQEEKTVGYVGAFVVVDEVSITNIAVNPECRKQGIAQKLIAELSNKAKEIGGEKIFLEVRVSNVSAIKLYEKSGFVTVGKRKNFYSNPTEDAFIYRKEI